MTHISTQTSLKGSREEQLSVNATEHPPHVYDAIQRRMFFYEQTFEKVRESFPLGRTQYINPSCWCLHPFERDTQRRRSSLEKEVLRKLLPRYQAHKEIK